MVCFKVGTCIQVSLTSMMTNKPNPTKIPVEGKPRVCMFNEVKAFRFRFRSSPLLDEVLSVGLVLAEADRSVGDCSLHFFFNIYSIVQITFSL